MSSESQTFESTSVESSTVLVSHPADAPEALSNLEPIVEPISEPTHIEPNTEETEAGIPADTTPITVIDETTKISSERFTTESSSASTSSKNDGTHQLSNAGQNVVLYQPPTVFTIFRSAAINLMLPFINGLMLGFGELFAHEIAFRFGWGGTRVFPQWRSTSSRPLGPGVEVRNRAMQEDAAFANATTEQMEKLTALE
ncbi:TOM13-domain-containing protein [Ascobolus immersus RN42]|uniref:TOM13-domain-containing protein n=1 Tax=Ascobolus immersus RN42 TaxID=1160509 RepID=A0A3N4IQ19_ASCIM|nr:TOM13-domain-containing protein [Ascobolus immersus RN42]